MNVIGIIGAMELEVDTLKAKLANESITTIAGMDFHQGTLNGVSVVIVRSGVGKVNAALCVQTLVNVFHVTHLINTGAAGSLNPALEIGDFLISRDAMQHDVDATAVGYELGVIPQMKTSCFPADERLVKLAVATCERINPEIHALTGRVVSGDQFIADHSVKARLISNFHGDCAEMEGGAIAQGAYLNDVPFVIIRAISDKADASDDLSYEFDYPAFELEAAKRSAKLTEALITQI